MLSNVFSNLMKSTFYRLVAFLIVGFWIGDFMTFTSMTNGVIYWFITFALAGVSWQMANALEYTALIEAIKG